jgi:hypothetical protein
MFHPPQKQKEEAFWKHVRSKYDSITGLLEERDASVQALLCALSYLLHWLAIARCRS